MHYLVNSVRDYNLKYSIYITVTNPSKTHMVWRVNNLLFYREFDQFIFCALRRQTAAGHKSLVGQEVEGG